MDQYKDTEDTPRKPVQTAAPDYKNLQAQIDDLTRRVQTEQEANQKLRKELRKVQEKLDQVVSVLNRGRNG